ncbi:MAG: CHASE3 domain-containing protein [Verrucomicrobia bacterium]|nr:CHASE3 domain-containing protein [Verrucomicrobiota bacterium]
MKLRFRALARSLPRLSIRVTICFVLALALLGALGALHSRNVASRAASLNAAFAHYDLGDAFTELSSALTDAENAARGFLLTQNPDYRAAYGTALPRVPRALAKLRSLIISDDPAQRQHLDALQKLAHDKLAELQAIIDLADAGQTDAALQRAKDDRAQRTTDVIRQTIAATVADEERQATRRRLVLERRRVVGALLENILSILTPLLLLLAFIGLLRQIARTQRAESTARAMSAKLEIANAELQAFAYSVAHDLRRPLRVINERVAALREKPAAAPDADMRATLEHVAQNGTRMAHLIEDLLALSKVSFAPVEPRRIDMAALVQDVCNDLLPAAQNAGRRIELHVDKSLPPAAGDPSLVRQIWVNLVDNALKFTRGRTPAHIEIGGTVAGGDFATYFVRDNGAGFNMTGAGKLFGAFQRLHPADEFEGNGIGLALVSRIVQRHGGAVWGEATEGGGAQFAFTLPEWVGG